MKESCDLGSPVTCCHTQLSFNTAGMRTNALQ